MEKIYKLTINCETPEIRSAMSQILMMSKQQLAAHITMILNQDGITSDTRITIEDDEITITKTSPERGLVLISSGIGFEVTGYDTLVDFSKYMVVERGAVQMYVKMPDKVDANIAQFDSIETAVENVNSNDTVDAVNNLKKKFNNTEMNNESNTIDIGNTEEVISGV